MTAIVARLISVVAVGCCVASVAAAPMNVLEVDYKPLLYSKGGRIEGCGVSFNAIGTSTESRALAVQGSIIEFFFEDKPPSMSMKVALMEATPRGEPTLRAITHASIKTQRMDTQRLRQISAEDRLSRLIVANLESNPEFISDFMLEFLAGSWVTVTTDPAVGDLTARLPALEKKKDGDTVTQTLECSSKAWQQFSAELKAKYPELSKQ